MKSDRNMVGLKSNDWRLYKNAKMRHGKCQVTMEAETGVMCLQSKDFWKPPEAERDKERIFS